MPTLHWVLFYPYSLHPAACVLRLIGILCSAWKVCVCSIQSFVVFCSVCPVFKPTRSVDSTSSGIKYILKLFWSSECHSFSILFHATHPIAYSVQCLRTYPLYLTPPTPPTPFSREVKNVTTVHLPVSNLIPGVGGLGGAFTCSFLPPRNTDLRVTRLRLHP